MTIFEDDLNSFIDDMGVEVISESSRGLGILDQPDEVLGDLTISTEYILTVKASDFSGLAFDDELEVDGLSYSVKTVKKIDDGKFLKIGLSKL